MTGVPPRAPESLAKYAHAEADKMPALGHRCAFQLLSDWALDALAGDGGAI